MNTHFQFLTQRCTLFLGGVILFLGSGLLLQGRPTITAFSPSSGAPGTSVKIFGTGFLENSVVTFNGARAISQVISSTEIATAVPIDATSGSIRVEDSTGSDTTGDHFRVAPRVSSFEPARGTIGTPVIISGANFTGANAVFFNGFSTGSIEVTSDSQIRVSVPLGATSGPISVRTPIGTGTSSGNFVVVGPGPEIEEFFPERAVPGTTVTIFGQRFTGVSAVKFNGTNATDFDVVADTQINVRVPLGASSGPITVQNPSGTGLSATSFIVSDSPMVEDFSPIGGNPGTLVTIFGQNFITGGTQVYFAGSNSPSVSVVSPNQLHARVPTNSRSGRIIVTTARGSGISSNEFSVFGGPVITGFSPTRAGVGDLITISGANFVGATAVFFHSNVSGNFAVTSDTQIQAQVPPGATNGPIRVVSSRGTGTSAQNFTVVSGPVIDSFNPRTGLPGDNVTLSGANFTGASSVQFNGREASFSVTADSQILTTIPVDATTGPIQVITALGTALSLSNFVVTPLIFSISPTNAVVGSLVTIVGRNFEGTIAVKFNQANANFSIISPQEILAVVPTNAPNGPISLTTEAGIVASTNRFLVVPEITRFHPPVGPRGATVRIFGYGLSEVISVKFNGVNAPSFTLVTPNELRAVVPSTANSGPIDVLTSGGSARSSTNFLVGIASDLTVLGTALPDPVVTETPLIYRLIVTNQGPSAATGVTLSNLLPENVIFVSAVSTLGRCNRTNQVIICALGNLPARGVATVTVTVKPRVAGIISNLTTVFSQQLDFDEVNNFLVLETTVIDETNRPTVTLSFPAANARVTNGTIQVRGTARDNRGLAAVYYRVNSNETALAEGTTNWTAQVDLQPGTNVLSARSVDLAGNESLIAMRTIFYVVKSMLTVEIVGTGTVSPNLNGKLLEIGRRYVLTGRPGRGQIFERWSGDLASNTATLSFLMAENLFLRASFIPNPFPAEKGSYYGLFQEPAGALPDRSGFISLTLGDPGSFSGRLLMAASSFSFSGRFDAQGQGTVSVRRPGTNALSLQLNLNFLTDRITGSVGDGNWTANLDTYRAVYNARNPAPMVGKYTMLLQGSTDSSTRPGGYGYGSVTVNSSGALRITGNTGDGSVISQSVPVSASGEWPFFQKLYRGRGFISGWLQIDPSETVAIDGTARWSKRATPAEIFYPAGFTNDLPVTGVTFHPPLSGQRVFPATNATVIFVGGNLTTPLTNPVVILPNHRISNVNTQNHRLTLFFTPSSGLLSGSFLHPDLNRTVSVKGAVLQEFIFAAGYFKGTNQTGYILLQGEP